ncbi:MAG: C45 family peptidase [Anaerolineae bacterium]
MRVPIVDAAGSHYDIGLTIGRAVPERIAGMIRSYQTLFANLPGFKSTWPQAIVHARQYLPYIEEAMPQYVTELRGMADGSGVPFDELLLCNCFEELTDDMLFEKCTTVALSPDLTDLGHVLLGHTEDWLPVDREWQYVVRVRPDDEPAFISAVYGGLLPNVGFNDNGLAQCINTVYPNDARVGIPRLFIGRHVLAAPRLGVALERSLQPRRAAGYNHVIADDSGEIYSLETTAAHFDVIYARDGYVTHTNHYQSNRLRDLEVTPEELIGSHVRVNRAERLVQQTLRRSPLAIDDIQRILSDHVNQPYSICAHAEDVPPREQTVTISAYVIDLTARTMWYCYGNPCRGEFVPITLEG